MTIGSPNPTVGLRHPAQLEVVPLADPPGEAAAGLLPQLLHEEHVGHLEEALHACMHVTQPRRHLHAVQEVDGGGQVGRPAVLGID